MTARANWFIDELPGLDDELDPFAVPIEEVGERIDLLEPEARLHLRFRELLDREGRLFNRAVTCAIKDRPDTTCHACPISKAHDRADPLGPLCRLGREQEVVLTELAVITWRDQ